jgi:PAS domain S-box-containing protein
MSRHENTNTIRILIIEDLPDDAELVKRAITATGMSIRSIVVNNPDDLRRQLTDHKPDIVLSDYSMPKMSAMDALQIVRDLDPDLPFIFVSGTIGEERAIEVIKAGATDYVLKDHLTRLPGAMERALKEVKERCARLAAEQKLYETQERLNSTLNSLHDAVWSIAVPGEHILYNNDVMQHIYGRPAHDFVKNNSLWREVIHPDDQSRVAEAWEKIYTQGVFDHEYRILHPDGSVRWIRDWAHTYRDEKGEVVRIDGITSDITLRKQAELDLARRTTLYEMLSHVNQAIVHSKDRDSLFQQICRIAVEHGHLRFASITLLDSSIDRQMRPVASYGEDTGYVELARIASDALDPAGQGPTGQAVRSGAYAVSNDFLNDPMTLSWRAMAKRARVRASAAFPLRLQNEIIGTLNLYAAEPEFFSEVVLPTFDEIAMDISFAIDNYQHQDERRSTEERFQVTIESAPNALIMTDAHGIITLANSQSEKLFGYGREKLLGQPIEMLIPERFRSRHVVLRDIFASKPDARAMGAGRDLLGLRSDGAELPIEVGLSTIEGAQGVSVLASIVDISERRRNEEVLRHNEERFRSLVEATSQIVWHADAEGSSFSYSPSFEKITGIDGESMSEWGWLQAIHPDDRERIAAVWQTAVKAGKLYTNEYRLHMRDGMYRWFDVHALPIMNSDGSVREWIGTCADIHDRVIAEREVRTSRRQYQELVDESIEGIYMRTAEGRFLFVNPAFCQMLGYEQYTLLQMQVQDILDLKDPEVNDFLQRALQGKELQPLQATRLKHRGGHWIDALATVKRLPDGRIQGMVRDVTKRKEAERELAEEQKFIVTSLDSVPGIFYVFDSQGKPLRWNKNFEQISGYSNQQIQQMRVLDFIAEEHRSTVKDRVAETFLKGESSVEADLLTHDGRRIPYYFSGRNFQWMGKPCLVGMGLDISDRRLAERRIRDYLSQTQRLSQELLKAQDQERRRIAHELHDEVGATLSALQISLHKSQKDAPVKLKKSLQEDLTMIVNLLGQVRKLSLDLRPSVLDDLGLLPAVRWYVREHLKKSDLEVQLDIPRALPRLSPEIENACFRVLQGAATNALRHAHARNLTVHLRLEQGVLELDIHDDGAGFDVDAAQTRARGGASLGLLAMEERVRLVGGEFSLSSKSGEGTDVRVRINVEKSAVT